MGEFAMLNGIRTYYEVHGDDAREPLVLLHGGLCRAEVAWKPTTLPSLTFHICTQWTSDSDAGRTGSVHSVVHLMKRAAAPLNRATSLTCASFRSAAPQASLRTSDAGR